MMLKHGRFGLIKSKKAIMLLGLVAILIIVAVVVLLFNLPARSTVLYINGHHIELTMRSTDVSVNLPFYAGDNQYLHVRQMANQELRMQLSFDGVVEVYVFKNHSEMDISDFQMHTNLLGRRVIFFSEELIIPAVYYDSMYTFVLSAIGDHHQNDGLVMVQPYRVEPLFGNEINITFKTLSCLQLALFAHMAYFPFAFEDNEPSSILSPKPHDDFYETVVVSNIYGLNSFGFNFACIMSGWQLYGVHTDYETSFSVAIYQDYDESQIVLAFRGTSDSISIPNAILNQTGTWWCNFRALAEYEHSQIESLAYFLSREDIFNKLYGSRIYVTGHSLGGYLAYIAAYELIQLGLESNLHRVAAFNAPIFNIDIIERISRLEPATRSKITHFYVAKPRDWIAGIVGITPRERPNYNVFGLIGQLFRNMQDVHQIDVATTFTIISGAMEFVGNFSPVALPGHIPELVWWLEGAFSEEAKELYGEFYELILHIPIEQSWSSPPREPLPWLIEAIVTQILDMVERIFDTDAHHMMNFYQQLATQSFN